MGQGREGMILVDGGIAYDECENYYANEAIRAHNQQTHTHLKMCP